MATIKLTHATLEVVVLDRRRYYEQFTPTLLDRPDVSDAYTFEDYADEKRGTEQLLRETLGRRWREVDDFEVGWDENVAFTLCGGIYSLRIVCREYLEVLHGTLRATRRNDRWAYATAMELDAADAIPGADMGEFVLQGNRVTVLDWHGAGRFDFVRYFSRPLPRIA